MNRLRDKDITYLKGVGPARAKLLAAELGIKTVYDLLMHFPSGYVDRSRLYRIADFTGDMPAVIVKGRFITFAVHGEGAKRRLVGLFSDGSGVMEIVWFTRIDRIRQAYHVGNDYIVFGKPAQFNGRWSMTHPEVDAEGTATDNRGLRGVYPLTERLRNRSVSSRTIATLIAGVIATLPPLDETLPHDIVTRLGLMPLRDAIAAIHLPQSPADIERARYRFKFEELFYLQLNIRRFALRRAASTPGYIFRHIGTFFMSFYNRCLPFPLTGAQKRVIHEIRDDMASGRQMNRLLQGDVGSGKTLVAVMTMLIAIDNGTQACIMAPTEILATQHFETLTQLLAPVGVNIKLLTGSTPAAARRHIHRSLLDGSLHILVGTHAVIEDNVRFNRLGYVVIDEQHRFGVAQRARLWAKNTEMLPHVLVMTATPIPRTLAMTVYGDLEVSVIDELPPGRKPVVTTLRFEPDRLNVYRAIGHQLRQGRQVYIVYPLIDENEKLDLKSLEEGYETICEIYRGFKVAYVHGRMKPAEKDHQMQLFASGEARILVATTVIEVGVNVPNASVMLIENAERFGLSQLHQLRGRVGRGADQSFCILMSKQKIARTTRERLTLMTQTSDGFVIAEADMKQRGPGDIEGTMQSGIPFDLRLASLSTDSQIVALARQEADRILAADPALSSPSSAVARRQLSLLSPRNADWSRIS